MSWILLILLLLAGAVLLYLPYRQDLDVAYRRLNRIPSQRLKTACGTVEVALRGQGPAVLSIHGSAGGYDQGLDLARRQLGPGYRVIAPSLFGYLGTPLPESATPRSQAKALVCMLDSLGQDRVAVITSSAGGPAAVQLALHYPERVSALVLISTAIADKPLSLPPRAVMTLLARSNFLFWTLAQPLRPLTRRIFVPASYKLAPKDEAEVADLLDKLLPIRPRAEGLLFDMYMTNTDPHRRGGAYPLEDLLVPTLVINAKDDPLANYWDAQAMSRRIPTAQFVTVPAGGHVMAGSGNQVSQRINHFLGAQAKQAGQIIDKR